LTVRPAPNWTRALSALALATVALWNLLGFLTWHELTSGVRVGFPKADNIYGQHLLFDGPVQAIPILAALLLHVCAAIIGYWVVIYPIWGRRRLAAEVWLFLAGIVPGTLIFMTLSRLVSLVLTHAYAPAAIWIAVIGAAMVCLLRARREWRQERLSLNWATAWPATALVATILVFTIQMDRFHILGEASTWFTNEVYFAPANGIGTAARFPLVSQHYDEAALLYPVVYGLVHRGAAANDTLAVLYWIMVSLGRASMGSLIYLGLRSFRVDRLSALACLAFVCMASLSINPASSRLLFDSLNPLAYALHIARFLISVLPFLLVSALAEWRGKANKITLLVCAALGCGLSAMPIHGLMVLAWALPIVAISEISPDLARKPIVWWAATGSATLILVAFMLSYGLATHLPAVICVGILLASSVIGAGALLVSWSRSQASMDWRAALSPPVLLVLAMCLGYAVGIALLGNIFIAQTDKLLGQVWPWAGMGIADRAIGHLATSSGRFEFSPYCNGGYYWEYRTLAGHCGSLPLFVRSYGLPLAIMAAVIVWRAKRHLQTAEATPDWQNIGRQNTMIFCGIMACLLVMPLCFMAYDFVAPANAPLLWERNFSIWVRSRLTEPWFYSGILLSLALFFRDASPKSRRWALLAMVAAIAVGSLVPTVMTGQMIVNFTYLFQAMLPLH
jgi:hypothetical protein